MPLPSLYLDGCIICDELVEDCQCQFDDDTEEEVEIVLAMSPCGEVFFVDTLKEEVEC